MKSNPVVSTNSSAQLDEEQIARTRDREEWARQATQRRRERMNTLDEARRARDALRKSQEAQRNNDDVYDEMIDRWDSVDRVVLVNRMLGDLYRLNPEWEIRKEQVRRVSHSLEHNFVCRN